MPGWHVQCTARNQRFISFIEHGANKHGVQCTYSSTDGLCRYFWAKVYAQWQGFHGCRVCMPTHFSATMYAKGNPISENSYWVGLMGLSTANMNAAFADIAKSGATVVRTW